MNCYIDRIQQNIVHEYNLQCQWDSAFKSVPPFDMDLHKIRTVPMLNIQFVNTETYDFSKEIYDYIAIDSVWLFSFACIDKKMNVYAFVNLAGPGWSYWDISDKKSPYTKEKLSIKAINKVQPELFLYCASLTGGFGDIFDNGFMYIKNSKIYTYNKYNGKSYELNEYFRTFFSINNIRRLNYSFIPIIHQKDEKSTRRTGNAPKNEIMICPPLPK
jgi:hypothetical protein